MQKLSIILSKNDQSSVLMFNFFYQTSKLVKLKPKLMFLHFLVKCSEIQIDIYHILYFCYAHEKKVTVMSQLMPSVTIPGSLLEANFQNLSES